MIGVALAFVRGNWRAIIGGVLAVTCILTIWQIGKKVAAFFKTAAENEKLVATQKQTIAQKDAEIRDAAADAETARKGFERQLEAVANEQKLMADDRLAHKARAAKIETIREAARNAPNADDAPINPSMRATIDGLRGVLEGTANA